MWYLKSAFETFERVQETVQNRLTDVQSALLSPVDTMKRLLGGNVSEIRAKADPQLDVLRTRVAELEAQLKKVRQTKKRKHRKAEAG
jgi:BMFP domain-containing protein YqiC